ncbi:cytochrome ubiquinol oxidase subunit I [Nonomuraea sp. NPDC050404]|uniref:cytochrome ubiquinol oxidase subunit I n=1 Tax=Nonomuraea sp. NPDC050404 TaxID=3155783 RepID=UPI0033C59505
MIDALSLLRIQFAATGSIHFLFVTLSLGLVVFVASMQTAYTVTGKQVYARMTAFWGTIYVINYALGIVTGLVMEFQFGLNWAGLSDKVGNVFGVPLVLETLLAFVVEATFLGMWIFGWNTLPKKAHLALIWLVALAAYTSAFWILVANAFMQHPVGYELRDGRAVMTDFGALVGNAGLLDTHVHVGFVALMAGGMVVTGVSAWHLIKRNEVEFFTRSLRWALPVVFVSVLFVIHFGFRQAAGLRDTQPAKLAALLAEPAPAVVAAPPSWIITPYQLMQACAFIIQISTFLCVLMLFRNAVVRLRAPLYLLAALAPLPLVAVILGWLVREAGRQPWAVYGLLTIQDAASDMSTAQALVSTVVIVLLMGTIAAVNYWLILRFARRGPNDGLFGLTLERAGQEEDANRTLAL